MAESGLGYRLRFSIDQLELNRPDTMTFRAAGDLVGRAVLRFVPFGRHRTLLLIEWDVDVTRPWMRRTDPVLRPVFGAAHAMVMSQGERRFRRWLGDSSPGR
ncbi:hypothetical protein EHW97_09340 [Aeromicrobium camelliae]|uniref:SRPBCC family protein n=1 Tax=Aeromicrobium camelliae TaxID=1538144 RepID=A0A3N6ZBX2_9ACTN|nr:hypothetical protein [Aeromicrobium camelliae]RQN07691.1 hypothetical protein EHW97_09340 [Aeromicrobium camelliae]